MRILSVVGARPQFVKLAPVSAALRETAAEHVIVHTGQHYDTDMSDIFFSELRIPTPDVHLGIGSASHGAQTGAMLAALEDVIDEQRPDWVIVYGDTNSTLAAALAAVKLHIPVAHLEAGLRSHNRRMPEEHNRVLTDHAADLLLAPTTTATANLEREGLARRTVLVGDVMTDICHLVRDAVTASPPALPPVMSGSGPYVVATIHRADNTDDPDRLEAILDALAGVDVPVVLPVHPRLLHRAEEYGITLARGAVQEVSPFGYAEMVAAVLGAAGVVTDSGGLQKEAFLLGTPCTTIRGETEWTETLDGGWNLLDDDLTRLPAAACRPKPAAPRGAPFGDGHAAQRVARLLVTGTVDL